jgi:hypothetical protein
MTFGKTAARFLQVEQVLRERRGTAARRPPARVKQAARHWSYRALAYAREGWPSAAGSARVVTIP